MLETKELQAVVVLVVLLKAAAENIRESDYKWCKCSKDEIFERVYYSIF